MQGYIIDICIAVCATLLVAIIVVLLKTKEKNPPPATSSKPEHTVVPSENNTTSLAASNASSLVGFSAVGAISPIEEKKLVEIKGKQLLDRIDGVIPGTMQAVVNSAVVANYSHSALATGQVYQAIVPAGEKLSKSLDIEGAVRGFTQNKEGKISNVANFVDVDKTPAQNLAAANAVNAVMGVASMVVGQYYMTQINNQLDKVSDQLKNIETFQKSELKGKIFALIASIQKSATFQYEVLQNDDVRNRELSHLKMLEHECAELLGQVNLTLQDFSQEKIQKYRDYEKSIGLIQEWVGYQDILLRLLGKIGDLTYTLNLGAITKQNAYAMCEPYSKQSTQAQSQLLTWHQDNFQRFGIKLVETKRKRQGLDFVLMSVPSVFNKEIIYKDMSEKTATLIRQQMSLSSQIVPDDNVDLFNTDVRLIAKDGKLYYLPTA